MTCKTAALTGINNLMLLFSGNTCALLQEMNRIVCEIKLKVVIAFFFNSKLYLGNEWKQI